MSGSFFILYFVVFIAFPAIPVKDRRILPNPLFSSNSSDTCDSSDKIEASEELSELIFEVKDWNLNHVEALSQQEPKTYLPPFACRAATDLNGDHSQDFLNQLIC